MSRIIAIDWGGKRTGLAWTDPLQLIATGIGSFPTQEVLTKLATLLAEESVEKVILGLPSRLDGRDTHATAPVLHFKKQLEQKFPRTPVTLWDEKFTSKRATAAMIAGGASKKKRKDKQLINEVSAILILQDYLEAHP